MEQPATGENAGVGDDISELKRYIVDMMHSEMETVESIRQSEDSLQVVDARIERLKESILVEQERYKALAGVLTGDQQDVQLVEETQMIAAVKHKEYLGEVAERVREVDRLRDDYQAIRSALLSLRRSLGQATRLAEALSATETSTTEQMQQVRSKLQTVVIADERAAEMQKLRAKRRYVLDYSSQVKLEVDQVRQQRAQINNELESHKAEAAAIRQFLQHEELKVESVQTRIREETAQTIQETKRLEDKLEVQRKKFRTKARAEIGSLKKRVRFLGTEMEKETMMNEDVASFLRDRWSERQSAESRLRDRVSRIESIQTAISTLSRKIDSFDRESAKLDTTALQEDIDRSRKELAAVQAKLKKKKAMLLLVKDDHQKLESSLEAVQSEHEAIGGAIADADPSTAKDRICQAEAEKDEILESISSVSEKSELLQSECKKLRARNTAASREVAKLAGQSKSLSKTAQQKSGELRDQQELLKSLETGIQHGERLHHELVEFRAKLSRQQEASRKELQEQERHLKQQYAEREASFQAELDAWDSKITELRQRQFMAH